MDRNQPSLDETFNRLPPHSIEAEMSLLGALMLSGENPAAFNDAAGVIRHDDFYRADHQLIYESLLNMRRLGRPIDAITLREELKRQGRFEEVGGFKYLAELLNCVPSAAHAPHYARIVRELAVGRGLIGFAGEMLRECYAPLPHGVGYHDLLNQYAAKIAEYAAHGSSLRIRRLGEVESDWYVEASEGRNPPLLATGFESLDAVIGGFPIGGFTEIWARPSVGKSATIKSIMLNLSEAGTPTGIVSIEETERKIATNAIANRGSIDSMRMQQNRLTHDEMKHALETINANFNWPLWICDQPVKLSDVETAVNLLVQKHQCRAVFVDHIHLIDAEPDRGQNRTDQVTKISGALKALGKRHNIAMVAACQIKRQTERGKEMPPTLDSGRDSGALEQDADLVIGLHREDLNRMNGTPEERAKIDNQITAIILKNRGGKSGKIPLRWDGDHQRIWDWIEPTLPRTIAPDIW